MLLDIKSMTPEELAESLMPFGAQALPRAADIPVAA